MIFVVGNEVWFKPVRAEESSLRVSVGQEKDGIQVISTSLPWSVKVGYLGGEYDIELFPKASDSLFASAAPTMTVTPGLVDANPEGPLDTPSGPEKVADDEAVAPSGPADGADDLKTTENEDEDEGAAAEGTENASDPVLAEPTPTGDGEGESAEAAKADSGSPLDTGGPESVEDAMEGPPADNAEQKLAISEETVSTQVEEEPADVKVKSEAEK